MVAPPNYKHYPRSVSWQVASVLNPSLHNSLPASQLSNHSREKREREGGLVENGKPEEKPHNTAYRSWQEEEESGHKLTLPPQYVSPGELCKAMPKYMRIKVRPKTNNGKPVPFSTANSTEPLNPYSPGLSPRYDLAAGSPRSDSSGREIPRSVLDFPQHVASNAPQQAKSASGAASPASPARSLGNTSPLAAETSCETTPPVSAGYQNTPQSTSESRRLRAPPSGAPSPRIRSAVTSPMPPVPTEGSKVTDATPANATLLQAKLNTIAQYPELIQRVVQMESTAQGSPLSPANSEEASRLRRISTPPVALPPTPPIGSRQRRMRNPHPPEPTLETYKKFSPNTYATNTVWNDRRDTSREQTNPRRTILIKP